ncbi:MAG: VWA domain-containing protein [Firmicutes bacterium]|nr:VWA domain-containing protein [Bacillota bacterium]
MRDFFDELDFGDYSAKTIKISRKVPICMVLDDSGSMAGEKIKELNKNIEDFLRYVKNDPKAGRIADIAIITFGDTVKVKWGYESIENIKFLGLYAGGKTPMGSAVSEAIELLKARRNYYRENDIEHYKPIMLLMSDGEPTDDYEESAKALSEMVKSREIKIFPVGIGEDFNKETLKKFSPVLEPKIIKGAEGFSKLFRLLSSSSSNPEDDSLEKWFRDEA